MTPIVFVPGLLCTAELFAPQLAALWPYGPVTVASTVEGETIAEMAEAILATAPPRFSLVGFSMGGIISLEIMRKAPERVLKLALLDTTARPDASEHSARRRAGVALARSGNLKAVLAQIFATVFHPAHQNDAALLEINVRMGLTIGVEGFARQTEALCARSDARPGLAAISVPTLVLVGDQDPLTPPILSQELAAAIPNAQLVVVPECGHVSPLEQPQAVNRALLDWLAR